jgi:hypothetical protein
LSAVTVPVASSITSTSRFCTATVLTLTDGPLAAIAAADPPGDDPALLAPALWGDPRRSAHPSAAATTAATRPTTTGFLMRGRL